MPFEVDSYHINVPVGDCAIHLLVETSNQNDERKVHKAVLIDSGTKSGGAKTLANPKGGNFAFFDALQKIRAIKQYAQTPQFKLDTVVLSHWDEDHYGNFRQYLLQEIFSGPISFLKYDQFGNPETVFYAPNIGTASRLNGPSFGVMQPSAVLFGDVWKEQVVGNISNMRVSKNKKKDQNGDTQVTEDYLEVKTITYRPFGIFRCASENILDVLGVNLFTNDKLNPQSFDPNLKFTVENLLDRNPAKKDPTDAFAVPGMYCIGVNQTTFPSQNATAQVIYEDVTITNKASIASVILWDAGPGQRANPRCSHYSAGDADQTNEEQYLKWLTSTGLQTITTVKLSHHGSRSSTPDDMFKLHPKNVIISNPQNRFFHPGWEVMFWFCLEASSKNAIDTKFIALKYPFYLDGENGKFKLLEKIKGGAKSILNLNAFEDKKYEVFQKHLIQLITNANAFTVSPQVDPFSGYQADRHVSLHNGRKYILDRMVAFWEAHCYPKPSAHGYPVGTAARQALTHEWIYVTSRDDNNDGHWEAKAYDIPVQQTFPIFIPQVAVNSVNLVQQWPANVPRLSTMFNTGGGRVTRSGKYLKKVIEDDELPYLDWSANMYMDEDFKPPEENDDDLDLIQSQDGELNLRRNSLTTSHHRPKRIVPTTAKTLDDVPKTAPEPTEDTAFYFLCSVITENGPSDRFYKLPDSDPWDWFLSTSGAGVLRLEHSPISGDGESVPIVDDEMGSWFADALAAYDIRLIKSADKSKPGIGGFQLSIRIPRTDESNNPIPFIVIHFTTEEATLRRSFGSLSPAMGLYNGSTILIMGAKSAGIAPASRSESLDMSLIDIAKYLELDSIFQSPFLKVLHRIPFTFAQNGGSDGQRNAIWFVPQQDFHVVNRLEWDLEDKKMKAISDFLGKFAEGLNIKRAYIISKKASKRRPDDKGVFIQSNGNMCICLDIELTAGGKLNLKAALELTSTFIRLSLVLDTKSDDALDIIIRWIGQRLGMDGQFKFSEWLKKETNFISFPRFDFRRITIILAPNGPGATDLVFQSFSVDLEVNVQTSGEPVVFLFTYNYESSPGGTFLKNSSLQADLWIEPARKAEELAAAKMFPEYEDYRTLTPVSVTKLAKSFSLRSFDCFENAPDQLPTEVTSARIFLSSALISFEGILEPKEPSTDSPVAPLKIVEMELGLSYEFSESKTNDEAGGFSASIDISAEISPPPGSDAKAVPAKLTGSIDYANKLWTLHASILDLKATYLLQFFSKQVQSAAVSILEPFELREFDINYEYSSGKPSKLSVNSIIKIGKLNLDLGYHNRGDPWDWDFHAKASLETNLEPTDFGGVIDSMLGSGDHGIPEFVRTIKLDLGPEKNSVGLMMAPDSVTKSLIFMFVVAINDFRLQFIQVKYSKEAEVDGKIPPTKRVILASMSSLPKTDVPLIGDISQPFDEAMFLWAQKNGSEGLNENEVEAINRIMEGQGKTWPGLKPLRFKEAKKPSRPNALLSVADTVEADAPAVVIKSGMHFMLMLKDEKNVPKVVVDYLFGSGKAKQKTKRLIPSGGIYGGLKQPSTLITADEKGDGEAGGMSEFKKTVGPLAIKNIGFDYADKKLSIKMDASVALGPMTFDLYGFAIELDFSASTKFDLNNLPTPSASLGGLAVGYDKNPLKIEGGLMYTKTPEMTLFAGGILIQYLPWLFAAAGFYGNVKFKPNQPEKKTAFVYAMLEGPLVTFSFGQITGLKGGFGYNSSLRYPTAADIPNFPLIPNPSPKTLADKEGPKNAIMSIVASGWVTPTDESFWFAAGVKVTAFQMLEIDALIAVQWGAAVRLGLFALATATIPKPLPGVKGGFTFAFIQLGLTAVIDVGAGTVAIDGQLTPASYILHKDCKLSGGFAFYTWFDPSPHQGDWVFSLGGYHRMFKPPPHYPVPPRLAITWKFSNAIFIRGEAYFAVTPQMCMGGGRWNVSLSLGPLRAFYECFVDFLVNFKPFHFRADGGLSVGVRFTLDLWLVTINISIEISATLYIEGPPVRGTVHVDFWVFGFNIDFGGKADEHKALSLDEFEKFVIESKENANAPSAFDTITCYTPIARALPQPVLEGRGRVMADPVPAKIPGAHVLSVTSGLIPSGDTKSTPSGETWLIRRAVFAFTVSCKFPVSRIEVKTGGEDPGPDTHTINGTGKSMYARPMRESQPMGSTMKITITPEAPPKALDAPPPAKVPHWDRNVGIVKKMPAAIWGPYDKNKDPSFAKNNSEMLDSSKENTVELLCGVNIMAPKQLTAQADTMKAFHYEKTMVQAVSDGKGPFKCDGLECQKPSLKPLQPIMKGEEIATEQWDLVQRTWKDKGKQTKADIDVAQIWQDFGLEELGWDKGKFDGTVGEAFGADRPVELLDEFSVHYLWPPCLNLGEKAGVVS